MSLLPIAWNLYVDWEDNGDFVDANEDVSADLVGATLFRGRTAVNEEYTSGLLTATLKNRSGTYSPFNTSSPLDGKVLPGRDVKLEAVHNSITYPIFRGRIKKIRQARSDNEPTVTLTCTDLFDRLSRGKVRLAMQEGKTVGGTGGLLDLIADEISLAAGLRSFEATAYETIPAYWIHQATPLDAFKRAARSDAGGYLFTARDGTLTFENRRHRSSEAVLTTLSDQYALDLGLEEVDFVDEVQIVRAGLSFDTTVQTVYSDLDALLTGRLLTPGAGAQNQIYGEFPQGGAKSVVTPVAVTDYTANTAADGSGDDVTDLVTVDTFNSYGGGFDVLFDHAGAANAYLTLLEVRGIPVRLSTEERRIVVTNPSSPVKDQVYPETFEFQDNLDTLEGYAEFRLGALSVVQPRPQIVRAVDTDAFAVIALGAELANRVTVQNTTGVYPLGLSSDFFIEGIELTLVPRGPLDVKWTLFHEDLVLGNFLEIESSTMAGGDRVGF